MNYDEAKREFIKTIEKLSYKYQKWEIFSDFCNMAAISFRQPFERSEELEREYLNIAKKYTKAEVDIFPKLLSYIIFALTDRFGDFLGECFHLLELGNKYKGQFFTPYHISKFMTQIIGERPGELELLSEPACGSGGIIIARAETLMSGEVNYQQNMVVQAVDVDILCVYMCYIQLTLLHIPAEVIHGNSLSLEIWSIWRTPAYYMSNAHNILHKKVRMIDNVEVENKSLIYTQEQINTFEHGRLF